MEKMLNSKERTLVMFDAVCAGLSNCLALVHGDIKQMTEHRNKLALLEQEQQAHAKFLPATAAAAHQLKQILSNNQTNNNNNERNNNSINKDDEQDDAFDYDDYDDDCANGGEEDERRVKEDHRCRHRRNDDDDADENNSNKHNSTSRRPPSSKCLNYNEESKRLSTGNKRVVGANETQPPIMGASDDDPHHFAALRLLDKTLADSFSQMLSMSDIQRSSIVAKHRNNSNRTSIFQVLLGKSSKQQQQSNGSNYNERLSGKLKLGDLKENNRNRNNNNKLMEEEDGEEEEESVDNKMMIDDISKQIRLAMQYLKQLESHLLKVEDLKAKYEMHIKMGMAVKSVSHAYLADCSSPQQNQDYQSPHLVNSLARRKNCNSMMIGNDQLCSSSIGTNHSSLASSLNLSTWSMSTSQLTLKLKKSKNRHSLGVGKSTAKEFVDNINKIESEFESFMGSLLFSVEKIQGFARICQGDIFEITIKFGKNKHKLKSKIHILKDNLQKCDNRQVIFKAGISDLLTIKAYECKGFGKRVLLCDKVCETRDLFTARSQLMTISLNNLGSIKLNLVAQWNPIHLTPNCLSAAPGLDISHISLPPTPVSSSTMSSLSSMPSLNGATTTISIQAQSRRPRLHSPSMIDNNQHQYQHNQYHQQQQQLERQHQQQQRQHLHQELLYQAVDTNYRCYVPTPDYDD